MSITREDSKKLVEEIKLNTSRLCTCEGPHDFHADKPGSFQTKYTCSKCKGQVDSWCWLWYQRGLEHGKKSQTP